MGRRDCSSEYGKLRKRICAEGKKPVLKVQTVKIHINMISAISNQGHVKFMFSDESIDSDKLIEFMERLFKDADCKTYLILDNLKAHRSKKTTAWVETHMYK